MFLADDSGEDDSEDRSPWGDFWFKPVPYRPGVSRVTADSAMRLTAVYASVRVLAEAMACVAQSFRLYRLGADKRRAYDTTHWLYRLLAEAPNDTQSPFEWFEMMEAHCALRGNGYSEIVANAAGQTISVLPLHPDAVTIEVTRGRIVDWRYKVDNGDGTFRYLARPDVFHLRALSNDGICGINPIRQASQAVGLAMAAESYGARFFENDARPGGGWIEYPGSFKDQAARNNFRQQWQRAQGGKNRGKTAVLEFGMKYHDLPINNEDAQFLDTRKMQIAEIARLFRVPPHMIGDLDRATNNNIEQQSLDFILHCMSPWIARWKAAIRSTWLYDTPDEDLQIDLPVTTLLRGDLTARANFYQSGITNGWLLRNEAREDDDRDPIDGLDEPLQPLNMVTPDQAERESKMREQQSQQPPAPKQVGDTSKADEPGARAFALAHAAAERIARKESRMCMEVLQRPGEFADKQPALLEAYEKHAEFVRAALDVSEAAAKDYCAEQLVTLTVCNGAMRVEDFEALTTTRCERLALKGTL